MATWNRLVSGSTAGNVSLNIDYAVTSVTRTSNTNVRVTYGIRFSMATSTYTYNSIAAFCPAGGTRYYAFNHSSGHTSSGTYYYANTSGSTTTSEKTPFTQDITVTITQTSASFEVGYGWDAYQPSQKGKSKITVTFPTGATAPTGLSCSVSGTTETSCTLSGSYSSNGNATVTASGFQYRTEGGNWTNCTSTPSLSPTTKYYFRYYATNSQGTTYSSECNTTTYDYPKPLSLTDFTIGDGAMVALYNPLARHCRLDIISNVDGSVIGTYEGTYGGNGNIVNGEFATADAIDKQYKSIPNQQSGTYYAKVTYGSSVKTLGDKTYRIKGDEIPTFEVSNITNVVDTLHVSDITGLNTKIIKGHNKITGNITKMTPNKHSNGSRYVVSANATPASQELSYDNGATKSFILDNITANSFSVTAYDTRGLPNAKTKTIDLVEYTGPKVNNLTLTRQNGLGTYAILTADGTFTHWSGWDQIKKYNTIQKVYYRYKPSSSNTWTTDWLDITNSLTKNTNGSWTVAITLDIIFETTTKYDFQLYVQDLLENSQPISNTLSTANGFLWRDLKNKFLGINKKPTCALDVNGNLNVDGVITSHNNVQATKVVAKAVETEQGYRGKELVGGHGTSGYMYAFDITTTGTYQNQYFTFDILQRSRRGHVEIQFASNQTAGNLVISSIRKSGTSRIYYTNSNNVFSFYIEKSEGYDNIEVCNIQKGHYMESTSITWKNQTVASLPSGYITVTRATLDVLSAYPIGSIYMSTSSTNPQDLFGGTWRQIKGRFLVGTGANEANDVTWAGTFPANDMNIPAGEKGGGRSWTIPIKNVENFQFTVPHIAGTESTRSATNGTVNYEGSSYYEGMSNSSLGATLKRYRYSFGGGEKMYILPPYLAVYMWERIG